MALSPTIKTAASVIVGTAALLGAMWGIDSHYASAADVKGIKEGVSQQIQDFRTQQLEDQIFILELKKQQKEDEGKRLEPIDEAMLNRYKSQLDRLHRGQ